MEEKKKKRMIWKRKRRLKIWRIMTRPSWKKGRENKEEGEDDDE